MEKCTYRFIFNREKKRNIDKVEKPIHLEVRWSSQICFYYETNVFVKEEQWDKKRSCINKKHSQFNEYNQYLKDIRERIENIELDCKKNGILFTKSYLKELIQNSNKEIENVHEKEKYNITFNEWAIAKAEDTLNQGRISKDTKRHHVCRINKLVSYNKLYLKKEHVDFSDITPEYRNNVETYLSSQLQNSTLNKFLQTFRQYVGVAYKEGHIKVDPFEEFDYREEEEKEKDKVHLTEFELSKLEKVDRSELIPSKIHSLDRYLLSCYCGLRISDIQSLKKSEIETSKKGFLINKITGKGNGVKVLLPLYALFGGKGEKIVKYYLDNYPDIPTIFPPLSQKEIRDNVKEIAKSVEINKNVNYHSSRHTCGTILADKTGNPLLIQKILGHKKIQTSMVYIHNSLRSIEKHLSKTDWSLE